MASRMQALIALASPSGLPKIQIVHGERQRRQTTASSTLTLAMAEPNHGQALWLNMGHCLRRQRFTRAAADGTTFSNGLREPLVARSAKVSTEKPMAGMSSFRLPVFSKRIT